MNDTRKKHLTSDEMIIAIIDANDLSVGAKNHLAVCERCQREAEITGSKFIDLGEKARLNAPVIPKPLFAESGKPRPGPAPDRGIKLMLCSGFAVCLMLVISLGWYLIDNGHKTDVAVTGSGPELFLDDADRLVENSMPAHYQKIIEIDAYRVGDDLMDFIVPFMDNTDQFMGNPV